MAGGRAGGAVGDEVPAGLADHPCRRIERRMFFRVARLRYSAAGRASGGRPSSF